MSETVYSQSGETIGIPDEEPDAVAIPWRGRPEDVAMHEQWENRIQCAGPKSENAKLNILISVYRKAYAELTTDESQHVLSNLTPDGRMTVDVIDEETERMHKYRSGIIAFELFLDYCGASGTLKKEIESILKATETSELGNE